MKKDKRSRTSDVTQISGTGPWTWVTVESIDMDEGFGVLFCVFCGYAVEVHSQLQARQRFVRAAVRGIDSVAQLCRQLGISQKTGFQMPGTFSSPRRRRPD